MDSSFSNIYKVAFTACLCFLANGFLAMEIEILLILAWSIQSICHLASAKGNDLELYAFRQGVSRAYAFWQVLRVMRCNFMPLGKKYPEHMPFGKCSGQEPRLCLCFVKYLSVQLLTQYPPLSRGCGGYCWRCWCGFSAGCLSSPPPLLCRQAPNPPLPACACAGQPPAAERH